MNVFPRLLLLLALVLPAGIPVAAADFYTASVPVEDYSDRARAGAIRQGLVEVLVKITGDSAIGEDSRVRQLLARVDNYVLEYGYTTLPVPEGNGEERPGLTVAFAPAEIDRFLRAARLPVLPSNRPDLLVWVVTDEPQRGRHFAVRDEFEPLFDALRAKAGERGFSLAFPLFDLEDQLAMTADQAWQLDEAAVREASARYGNEFWLLLRLYRTSDDQWRGAWLMGDGSNARLSQTTATELPQLAGQVLGPALDRMVANLSFVSDGSSGRLLLSVDRIRSLADYRRLVTELEGSALVGAIQLRELAGERAVMALTVEAEPAQVIAALGRNPRLRAQQGGGGDGNAAFEWIPLP